MAKFAPQYNLFEIIGKLKTGASVIFWMIFLLSIIPISLKMLEINLLIDDLLNTLNIICISLFFVLEIVVEYILVPQADSRRRDDFIDNSFDSTFSTKPSIGYFNTEEIRPGIYRAATNLFENCFFTYSLVKACTFVKAILPIVAILSISVFAYYGFRQVPFALSLLQALFSATLLGELVKHFILMVRLHAIHDAWVILFQNQDFKQNADDYKALVYSYWLQYETLLSRIQTYIPDRIFTRLNPSLTEEWNNIKKRYSIN